MLTEVYISVSDKDGDLVVNGSLELLARLLASLRTGEVEKTAPDRGLLPPADRPAHAQAQEEAR